MLLRAAAGSGRFDVKDRAIFTGGSGRGAGRRMRHLGVGAEAADERAGCHVDGPTRPVRGRPASPAVRKSHASAPHSSSSAVDALRPEPRRG